MTTTDPLADNYPGWSSYNYALNNPTNLVDLMGLGFQEESTEIQRFQYLSG